MTESADPRDLRRLVARTWRVPRSAARLGATLVLVGLAVAAVGHRELFSLAAEEPARSVQRFIGGAAEVEITTQLPWSRAPAVLPGPADAWAGGTAHALLMRLQLAAPRALRLHVQSSRSRPPELPTVPVASTASLARLHVVANGTRLATFEAPTTAHPPGNPGSRAPPAITVPIPSAVLDGGTRLTLTLVNDGAAGVPLRHLRLTEAALSFTPRHLAHGGRMPPTSAAFLGVGLGLLLRARLLAVDARRPWRRALGPGLGLVLLTVAAAAPAAATHAVPRWAWLVAILAVLPLGRPRRGPASPPRAPAVRLVRAGATALLFLVALGISLAASELALRVAFRNDAWARGVRRLPAVGAHDRWNSLGFNEREFPLDKPPGTYRIAILGDSLSISAPQGQRFGDVIVERLNAQGPLPVKYEVVSFGKTGADTNYETEILERFAWRARPDFVLLEFYVNDLENGDHSDRPGGIPLIPGETAPAQWLRAVTDHLLLRHLLELQLDVLEEQLGLAETYPAYMFRRFGDPAGVHWQSAAYELREFIRQCREHEVPVALALFPHLSPGLSAGAYEFAELYDQVLALCRDEAVPCVDLRATFAPYRDYTSFWVHRFDPHPNARAHRLSGERIVEALGPVWLEAGRSRGWTATAAPPPPR